MNFHIIFWTILVINLQYTKLQLLKVLLQILQNLELKYYANSITFQFFKCQYFSSYMSSIRNLKNMICSCTIFSRTTADRFDEAFRFFASFFLLFHEHLFSFRVETATENRVRRWGLSMEELVSDPTGIQEFTNYLSKEFSHENIRFWMAVNDLRRSAQSQVPAKVQEIFK